MVVKRVGALSVAKIHGTVYALLGLVIGAIVSLVALLGAAARNGPAQNTAAFLGAGAIVGVGSIILFPLLYGAIGFVFWLIVAWFYNVLARLVGGIEVELE